MPPPTAARAYWLGSRRRYARETPFSAVQNRMLTAAHSAASNKTCRIGEDLDGGIR